MNPALPLLLVLALAGAVVWRAGGGRWEGGLAWAVAGVAAVLLLAPALAIPDGIPGPGAILARHVPWQAGTDLDPAEGNLHMRDVSQQIQPWLLHLRRELRAGRLPYWNPHQLAGAPFWANGQSAPLFPLHLLFALLPVQLGLVLLPWLRLTMGGWGAWALARELGVSRTAALVPAVAYPLSGTVAAFVLYPMGNAHALVPWVFLAVERLARERWGWAPLALLGGLQLASGHPETAVFTALLAAVYLAVRGAARPPGTASAWARFAGGWIGAGAVSAVHTVPLALHVFRTSRWAEAEASDGLPLPVLGSVLLRLVLPEAHGNPALGTWWGPFNYLGSAVYTGTATVLLAGVAVGGLATAGGAGRLRDRRWLAVAAMAFFALLAAYQAPGVRHLLGALPVLSKSLTHYLKLGLVLGLALLAGRGLDRLRAGAGRGALAAAGALLLAVLGSAWATLGPAWREHGVAATQAAWTAGVGALALAAVAWGVAGLRQGNRERREHAVGGTGSSASSTLPVERSERGERTAGAPRPTPGAARWRVAARLPALLPAAVPALVPPLLAADLLLAHGRVNPGMSAADLYPETGAVRFLLGQEAGGPAPTGFPAPEGSGRGDGGPPPSATSDGAPTPGARDRVSGAAGGGAVQVLPGRLAGVGTALLPNAALVYGLHDLRGDTPLKLRRYQEVYAALGEAHPVHFRPVRQWRSPWLDRLGVRWVLGPPDGRARAPGWRLRYDGADARVWERPTALPLVRWGTDRQADRAGEPDPRDRGAPDGAKTGRGRRLEVLARSPGHWLVAWESPEPAAVVVAETWDPGWRARVDDEPAPVRAVDDLLLGVRVGPGRGHLTLRYRPPGLDAGTVLSLLGLAACGAAVARNRRRRS